MRTIFDLGGVVRETAYAVVLGDYNADLLVENVLVVELKAAKTNTLGVSIRLRERIFSRKKSQRPN